MQHLSSVMEPHDSFDTGHVGHGMVPMSRSALASRLKRISVELNTFFQPRGCSRCSKVAMIEGIVSVQPAGVDCVVSSQKSP